MLYITLYVYSFNFFSIRPGYIYICCLYFETKMKKTNRQKIFKTLSLHVTLEFTKAKKIALYLSS